jgi:hypothetical protein
MTILSPVDWEIKDEKIVSFSTKYALLCMSTMILGLLAKNKNLLG